MHKSSVCFHTPPTSKLSTSNGMARHAVRRSEQASEKMKVIVGEERRLLLKQIAVQTSRFPSTEVVMMTTEKIAEVKTNAGWKLNSAACDVLFIFSCWNKPMKWEYTRVIINYPKSRRFESFYIKNKEILTKAIIDNWWHENTHTVQGLSTRAPISRDILGHLKLVAITELQKKVLLGVYPPKLGKLLTFRVLNNSICCEIRK